MERQLESTQKEQEALIDVFSEERNRRDEEEDNLRKKLKVSENIVALAFAFLYDMHPNLVLVL